MHRPHRGALALVALALALPLTGEGCKSDDDDDFFVQTGGGGQEPGPFQPAANRRFRAISGVSMGGYAAMNLGTKHADRFGVIGSLGGPVDMRELLRHMVLDNLEVKPQTTIPRAVGADFTFDHLPPYPDRETRISMLQDLTIALGNPVLHHPDPSRRYLASDSEPATLRRDDAFDMFEVPPGPRGFLEGGDGNEDGLRQFAEVPGDPTDVLLLAGGTVARLTSETTVLVGERRLASLAPNGVFDVGDGIVLNLSEPIVGDDGDLVFEPAAGETFDDVGLDGVPGTGDLGEGNGVFDYDPDRATWLAEDPVTRLEGRSSAEIEQQRIYMDVGTADAFEFEAHYANLVAVLRQKGLPVAELNGFPGDCEDMPELPQPYLLIRYAGDHIGIPAVDSIVEDLLQLDFCGGAIVWQRLRTLIAYANSSFPDGVFGTKGLRPVGDILVEDIPSPALTPPGAQTTLRRVVVYRPPAFFNTDDDLPILYYIGGYGQSPEDYERVGNLLDLLIAAEEVQNMFFVVLPGEGGRKGSFLLDHRIPTEQVPELTASTGRYEASVIEDLMPAIEQGLLNGRVRRE